MASPIVLTLLKTTWHTPADLLLHSLPFLNQGIDQVMSVLWMMRPLWNTSRNNIMFQVCSIGLRSGDLAGQFITLMHASKRKVMGTLAV